MTRPRIPHLRVPLQVTRGAMSTVDQDTAEEIVQNVLVIMRTRLGEVLTLPDFGVPDGTFQPVTEAHQGLVEAVQRWEPRATITHVETAVDRLRVDARINVERAR